VRLVDDKIAPMELLKVRLLPDVLALVSKETYVQVSKETYIQVSKASYMRGKRGLQWNFLKCDSFLIYASVQKETWFQRKSD
jgi:hypothetical protein